MAKGKRQVKRPAGKPATSRGLHRVAAYLHPDELRAVEREAERHRCSKSEILRRLIRERFGIED